MVGKNVSRSEAAGRAPCVILCRNLFKISRREATQHFLRKCYLQSIMVGKTAMPQALSHGIILGRNTSIIKIYFYKV